MQSTQPIYSVDLFGGLSVRPLIAPAAAPASVPIRSTGHNGHIETISRFRTHQTGALLAYLAHRAGRPQSREVLIEMLWPEVAQDSSLARLSSALSSLRSQLEGVGIGADSSIFQANRHTICITKLVTTDVAQFDLLLDEAKTLPSTHVARRRELTSAAMVLYRSELLPGYYEPWVVEEQARLADRALEAFLWLARHVAAQGDRLAAIGYARQAVAVGYSEEAEKLLDRLGRGQGIGSAESEVGNGNDGERKFANASRDTMTRGDEDDRAPKNVAKTVVVPSSSSGEVPPSERKGERTDAVVGNKGNDSPDRPSLTVPLTRFLGREKEMSQLCGLVERREARLIVLAGPAGVGKSRLLRESIARIKSLRNLSHDGNDGNDGSKATRMESQSEVEEGTMAPFSLFALDLAPLSNPHEFPSIVARAVGLDTAVATSVTSIANALAVTERPVLLLDNVEHLLPDAGEWLETLLETAPRLTCVVTSRSRLGVEGETLLELRPLALPDTTDTDGILPSIVAKAPFFLTNLIDECPSIALFVDRARNARPDFSLTVSNVVDVLSIVVALDGLPLAIELAAAWTQVMTLPEMRRRLQTDRFGVLQRRGGGASGWRRKAESLEGSGTGFPDRRRQSRHASLRDIIAQSAEQLDDELCRVLAFLSVFRGGWTVAAAEDITNVDYVLDHLSVLCDLSLVTSDVIIDGLSDGGTTVRFSLLESVREYAASLLSVESLAEARARHAKYFAAMVVPVTSLLQDKNQALWLDRLQREDANLNEALAWSRGDYGYATLPERRAQARVALSMGAALGRYWYLRGPVVPGRTHLATALSRSRRRLLRWSNEIGDDQNGPAGAEDGTNGIDGMDDMDDTSDELTAEKCRDLVSKAANSAAILAARQGDDYSAHRYYRTALLLDRHPPSASSSDAVKRAWTQRRAALLNNAGSVSRRAAQYERAYAFFDESLHLWRRLGESRFICVVLANLALIDRELGRIPEAVLNLRESLDVARTSGNHHTEATSLLTLGEIRHVGDEREEAEDLYRQSLAMLKPIGDVSNCAVIVFNIGAMALERAGSSFVGTNDSDVRQSVGFEAPDHAAFEIVYEYGTSLVASALRFFARSDYAPTGFIRQIEKRLRDAGDWPQLLEDLHRWQSAGFSKSLSLPEAVELALSPPPTSIASLLPPVPALSLSHSTHTD